MPIPPLSPYDILGVDPSATLPELTAAFKRAQREGRHPARDLTYAFNQLRNAGKRLELDLLVPGGVAADGDRLRELLAEDGDDAFLPATPPQPPAAALVVLRPEDLRADSAEPPPAEGGFGPVERFSAGTEVLPPLDIPL